MEDARGGSSSVCASIVIRNRRLRWEDDDDDDDGGVLAFTFTFCFRDLFGSRLHAFSTSTSLRRTSLRYIKGVSKHKSENRKPTFDVEVRYRFGETTGYETSLSACLNIGSGHSGSDVLDTRCFTSRKLFFPHTDQHTLHGTKTEPAASGMVSVHS